ncbi:MAG TPA: alpha-L-fucosidase [Candidatus Latescibacteria bacterium]|nr:alpha-L-fucosidase [Candidatus Latescibacterota bacterium]
MSADAIPERMKWWREATFGMFIHWGVYAVPARNEWVMYVENIPKEEYAHFADEFTARHYHAREWVKLAQDAGMKYMVLTTRHHDGFCLFDSKVSDFTAPKTAAKRDLIAEYAEACHALGMRMGFYYSLEDWRFPHQLPHLPMREDKSVYQPMVEQAHAQVRELMTNYGTVDILWYDGGFPAGIWRSEELNAMVRSLQPNIIINDRSGLPEDFGTPEQHIAPQDRPWEACMTMNDTWGYTAGDKNYKSVRQILGMLIQCASQGGNLLLNVGPDAEGRIPEPAVERLRVVGEWMRTNGKAIYGATRTPLVTHSFASSTRIGDKMYLLSAHWPGSTASFGWCGNRVLSAKLLATGERLIVEQKGDRVWLRGMPQYAPDVNVSVIEITVEGEPKWPEARFT